MNIRPFAFVLITGALVSPTAMAASGCGIDVNPARLDSDRNAELSRDEVKEAALAPVFDQVDSSGNGTINQMEYATRCDSLKQARSASQPNPSIPRHRSEKAPTFPAADNKSNGDNIVTHKTEREVQRQMHHVNHRVDREIDRTADKVVNKALGAIFGD